MNYITIVVSVWGVELFGFSCYCLWLSQKFCAESFNRFSDRCVYPSCDRIPSLTAYLRYGNGVLTCLCAPIQFIVCVCSHSTSYWTKRIIITESSYMCSHLNHIRSNCSHWQRKFRYATVIGLSKLWGPFIPLYKCMWNWSRNIVGVCVYDIFETVVINDFPLYTTIQRIIFSGCKLLHFLQMTIFCEILHSQIFTYTYVWYVNFIKYL